MPITQQRLHTILSAAEHLQLTIDSISSRINAEALQAEASHQTWEQALVRIKLSTNQLQIDIQPDLYLIASERAHYRLTNRRNDRVRRTKASARRQAGIIPRAAPDPQPSHADRLAAITAQLDQEDSIPQANPFSPAILNPIQSVPLCDITTEEQSRIDQAVELTLSRRQHQADLLAKLPAGPPVKAEPSDSGQG